MVFLTAENHGLGSYTDIIDQILYEGEFIYGEFTGKFKITNLADEKYSFTGDLQSK